MPGKYEKKRKKHGGRILLILLAAVLVLLGILWFLASGTEGDESSSTVPRETAPYEETSTQPSADTATQPPADTSVQTPADSVTHGDPVESFSLEGGLEITRYGKYIGLYMEDGSDEFLDNVMMILVHNAGDQAVQYLKLTLTGPFGDAVFSLSTLLPGQSVVVLESERKPFLDGEFYTEAKLENVALFSEMPSLQEEILLIQPLEGGFNISNISDTDIPGEITVYFKDEAGGLLYGGITYVARINGLAAGEVKQIMSANFTEKGSQVMFIGIAE